LCVYALAFLFADANVMRTIACGIAEFKAGCTPGWIAICER
jgi:hypothetical protein